jgi:TonB-linked SusC/RagA family outer membrane protein
MKNQTKLHGALLVFQKTSKSVRTTGIITLLLFIGIIQARGDDFNTERKKVSQNWNNYPQQQTTIISGKITDDKGEPMPGVNVFIKGTTQGTISDSNGRYSIDIDNPNTTLTFSFVGYKIQEIPVAGKKEINISMVLASIGLDEVISIGYGTVKKSDLTGSVSSVKVDDLSPTPLSSIDQGLQGRAAGVQVTQTTGAPGAVASIRIRGTNTLQAGNEPLYVIDGFPVYNGGGYTMSQGGWNKPRISGLSSLNPDDIESIEILKDAAATAIYGARGANGVVLITTKSGKSGKDIVSVNASYGIQSVTHKIDVMNAIEYADLVNDAYTNSTGNPYYDDDQMEEIRKNPQGTNWQDEIFRSAPTQDYQLSFSGGGNKTNYAISGNYFNQQGIIINSSFERYAGRINLDHNVSKKFKVGTRMSLSHTINKMPLGTTLEAVEMNPILPVYLDEENGIYTPLNIPGLQRANPVATANEVTDEVKTNRILNNTYAEYSFPKGFKAKVSFGIDMIDRKKNYYLPSFLYWAAGNAVASVSASMRSTWLNENIVTWNRKFGIHSFNIMAGTTFQQTHAESVSAGSEQFVNDVLRENSLQSGAIYAKPTSGNTTWGMISYIGRVNYNLSEKYLFSFNARYDGSSRFGENNKYGFFPSGAFAWRAGEEKFINNLNLFSNLKFRFSYGLTGNQEIPSFLSLPTMRPTTFTIGGGTVIGFAPNQIPNPDLKWETSTQADIGVDMGFLKNKILFTINWYNKHTTNLLYQVAVPYTSGFSTMWSNVGSLRNKGWEFELSTHNINGTFKWTTDFNLSLNKNEILELGGEDYKDLSSFSGQTTRRLIVGEEVGIFYGYLTDGLFQNQEELDAGPQSVTNWMGGRRYKDLSGPDGVPDGIIDATYDRTIIGSASPDFIGGLGNTFSYKGVSLYIFNTWSYGNKIYNYLFEDLYLPSGGQNQAKEMVNRWNGEGTSNHLPVATTNRATLRSDAYVKDGSFFKFKTITLSYSVPFRSNKTFKSLKVYVTAQNLFTITKYKGYDPEVSARGASTLEFGEDFGTYPQTKGISFGVNIDL